MNGYLKNYRNKYISIIHTYIHTYNFKFALNKFSVTYKIKVMRNK